MEFLDVIHNVFDPFLHPIRDSLHLISCSRISSLIQLRFINRDSEFYLIISRDSCFYIQ